MLCLAHGHCSNFVSSDRLEATITLTPTVTSSTGVAITIAITNAISIAMTLAMTVKTTVAVVLSNRQPNDLHEDPQELVESSSGC